jgi:hypothetical protein
MLQVGGDSDLLQKALGAQRRSHLGHQDFEGDLSVVLPVVREVDNCHPTATQFPLDSVAVGEGFLEAVQQVSHGVTSAGYGPKVGFSAGFSQLKAPNA